MSAKNAGDWPMKSPMSVQKLDHTLGDAFGFGWNGHGSGMIKLV
jgi:hypothetical protein